MRATDGRSSPLRLGSTCGDAGARVREGRGEHQAATGHGPRADGLLTRYRKHDLSHRRRQVVGLLSTIPKAIGRRPRAQNVGQLIHGQPNNSLDRHVALVEEPKPLSPRLRGASSLDEIHQVRRYAEFEPKHRSLDEIVDGMLGHELADDRTDGWQQISGSIRH